MSLRINFNVSAVRAQYNLRTADRLLAGNLQRLSTGLRINRSVDDPGGLVQANSMRYHLVGIEQAVANAEEGVRLIQTAEGDMDQINELLLRLRSLAINAANEAANDPQMLAAMQTEFDQAVSSITRIAQSSQYAQQKLLDGSLANSSLDRSTRAVFADLSHDMQVLTEGIAPDSIIEIDVGPGGLVLERERVEVVLTTNPPLDPPPATDPIDGLLQMGQPLAIAGGETITLSGPLGEQQLTLQPGTTIAQFVGLVNAQSGVTGLRAAYDAETGTLAVENRGFGPDTVRISSDDLGGGIGLLDSDVSDPDVNAYVVPGSDPSIEIHYLDRDDGPRSRTLTIDSTSPGGRTFSDADGAFRLEIRDTSEPVLGSTLEITPNSYQARRAADFFFQTGALSGQRVRAEIPDMRSGVLGQGVSDPDYLSLQHLTDLQALTGGDAQRALTVIDQAIDDVTLARGRLGAIQSSSLESQIEALRVSYENLTAAESSIRDTDFALESSRFALNNIRLNAATAMLAQANQLPNSVLQLLS